MDCGISTAYHGTFDSCLAAWNNRPQPYYDALLACGSRYKEMCSDEKLSEFIEEYIEGCNDKLPLMKLNRWLGYIQGVLISRGITTITEERDWTRPLFRPLDFGNNII